MNKIGAWCNLTVAIGLTTFGYAARVDAADGLAGRLIVGYQGWFGCPNDFEENRTWRRWFVGSATPESLSVDILPSVRGLRTQDLCDTGLPRADKQGTIKLFSSQSASVVDAHFRWMLDAAIDGAAAQRFVGSLSDPADRRRSDHVLRNVRAAAEANGRVFFLLYDISGANRQTVADDVRADWRYLVNELKLVDSPAYLHDNGKPVLELWGFGFTNRPGVPNEVEALIRDLKSGREGLRPVTIIGGVPAYWRTLKGDSKVGGAWARVYRSYDVISPWSVGRFSDEPTEISFMRDVVAPDLTETRRLGIRYMPVIFPGYSAYNEKMNHNKVDRAVLNRIPRLCGQFFWSQVSDLLGQHASLAYAAMFDEADEGTALFPAETRDDKLPAGSRMVYLNQDGCSLPDDWYLRVAGKAAQYFHRHEVPPRNLSDVLKP